MNPFYPIYLDLRGKKTLVVGGGEVALRKIKGLIRCEADVTVVAIEALAKIRRLEMEGRLRIRSRAFEDIDAVGMALVIAATDDEKANRRIWDICQRNGVPVNVVDVPDLCDFHVPAQVVLGDLKIAISTGGKAPAFAARVRNEIEGNFSGRYAEAIRVLDDLRTGLKKDGSLTSEERREIMVRAASSRHLNRYLAGKSDELDPEKLR